MRELKYYIEEVLGIALSIEPLSSEGQAHLPLYIRETYKIYFARIFDQPLALVIIDGDDEFSTLQIEKHLNFIKDSLGKTAVLVSDNMTAINRRRLIQKGINFIVPGKQLFIPNMLLDLRESFNEQKKGRSGHKLLPSAQYILLYHLQDSYKKQPLTDLSFKELAEFLGYTQMAITNAVENLRLLGLCEVEGVKEKSIRFEHEKRVLWDMAQPFLLSPVLKQIYVDEKPDLDMLHSNLSALPIYSDLNPSQQEYYAIGKTSYYELKKNGTLINENNYEGRYCLEVWKYYPLNIEQVTTKENVVDPLSLYLSLKDNQDERIEMALNQIIERYIW